MSTFTKGTQNAAPWTKKTANAASWTKSSQTTKNSLLLLEDGVSYLLQEDGISKLILESSIPSGPAFTHMAQEVG